MLNISNNSQSLQESVKNATPEKILNLLKKANVSSGNLRGRWLSVPGYEGQMTFSQLASRVEEIYFTGIKPMRDKQPALFSKIMFCCSKTPKIKGDEKEDVLSILQWRKKVDAEFGHLFNKSQAVIDKHAAEFCPWQIIKAWDSFLDTPRTFRSPYLRDLNTFEKMTIGDIDNTKKAVFLSNPKPEKSVFQNKTKTKKNAQKIAAKSKKVVESQKKTKIEKEVISSPAKVEPEINKNLIDLPINILKGHMCPHIRIKRWKTEDINEIKSFKDWDRYQATEVYHYQGLSDDEVKEQRARHYLPGTELLLTNAKYRNIYVFESDRGYGIYGRLVIKKQDANGVLEEEKDGVIYFGVGDQFKIYHRYFEDANLNSELLGCLPAVTANDLNDFDFDGFKSEKDFHVDIFENGVLKFEYGKSHQLYVMPNNKAAFKDYLES
jgi:hypothetical protein